MRGFQSPWIRFARFEIKNVEGDVSPQMIEFQSPWIRFALSKDVAREYGVSGFNPRG